MNKTQGYDEHNFLWKYQLSDEIVSSTKQTINALNSKGIQPTNKLGYSFKSERSDLQIEISEHDLHELKDVIDDVKSKISENMNYPADVKWENRGAWTIIGQKGSYHTIHNHTRDPKKKKKHRYSICIYLESPELISSVENSSEGRGCFVAIIKDKDGDIMPLNIPPRTGDVVIFSHSMYHFTYPAPKGFRQTLNLELEAVNV